MGEPKVSGPSGRERKMRLVKSTGVTSREKS
jgi:hypothetical protein